MFENGRDKGFVHLYTGDGKGKTTAAVGLAVRAAGCGRRVLFCQFLKGGQTGEVEPLRALGVEILRAKHTRKFTFQMTPEELEEAGALHRSCLALAAEKLGGGGYDLVVLDEAVDAAGAGLLPPDALPELIRSRPRHVELVLTGRRPDPRLEALADYYTDFVCRAHPYQRGITAREGIEY